jgi:hypothetical protein
MASTYRSDYWRKMSVLMWATRLTVVLQGVFGHFRGQNGQKLSKNSDFRPKIDDFDDFSK